MRDDAGEHKDLCRAYASMTESHQEVTVQWVVSDGPQGEAVEDWLPADHLYWRVVKTIL